MPTSLGARLVAIGLFCGFVPQLSFAQSQCTGSQLSVPFAFTGAEQTYVVPAGYASAVIHLRGAQGGAATTFPGGGGGSGTGGLGGTVSGTRLITPGETLSIFVGGQGNVFNGGGTGARTGGIGGGATDVRVGGNALANRVAVAGGGGGGGAAGAENPLGSCDGLGLPYAGGNGGSGGGGTGGNSAGFTGATGATGGSPGSGGAAGIGCSFAAGQAGTNAGAGGQSFAPNTCNVGDGGGGGGGAVQGGGGGGGSSGTTMCTLNRTSGGGGGGGGTSSASGLTAATLTSGVRSGNGTAELCLILGYNITPVAGPNGSISPNTVQLVAVGTSRTFTATVDANYSFGAWGGTCPGTPTGNTFNAGPISVDCTLTASFTINTYTVTPSAGANGTISPNTSQTVNHGSTTTFTATPSVGYSTTWSGTCPGTPSGNTFNTGPITGNCTVAAAFTLNTYTVTPSAGANGTISPNAPQTVNHGSTTTFTASPSIGYSTTWGGTCGGTPTGNTYNTSPITANCTVTAAFTLNTYTVTPSAGANGTISPSVPQTVNHGSTTSFTATPSVGYSTTWSGTCPGTPTGNSFNTGPITADCTVAAAFTLNTYTVTPSAGANGTIAPNSPQTVNHGSTTSFTATPSVGYSTTWGGTCGGTPMGNTYNTSPIIANCTVTAAFTLNTYTVTPSAGANGTISPNAPQTANHGSTVSFTATPNPGYLTVWSGTCTGTAAGNSFTAGPITAACTVTASFPSAAVKTYTGPSATGTGSITASFTGGGETCTFSLSEFIAVSGNAASPPAGTAPNGLSFPHGLFNFRTTLCTPGSTITMTLTYPSALPSGTGYWNYGPTPSDTTPHWYVRAATIAGNTVVFSVTDGALGDDDVSANGTMLSRGGPAALGTGVTTRPIPALSPWMLMLLASLVMTLGARSLRRTA